MQTHDPVSEALTDVQRAQLAAAVAALTQMRALVRALCEELGGVLVLLEEAVGEPGSEAARTTRDWLLRVARLDSDLGVLLAEIAS